MKKKTNQIALSFLLLLSFFVSVGCGKKPVNNGGQPTPVTPVTPVTPLI
jgi:hypothetical protein